MLTFILATAQNGEHAATHASGPMEFAWLPMVTSIVVFAIAFFVLARTVWPKITQALDERETKILEEIESAEEAKRQADEALQDYQSELSKAREEANQMIAKAREDAKATAAELKSRNETLLAEMKERATREIDSAKHQAISELHAEAATLAVSIASKILEREITVDDQKRLMNESLEELKGVGSSN